MVRREHRLLVGCELQELSRLTRVQRRGGRVRRALVKTCVVSCLRRSGRTVVRACPRARPLRRKQLVILGSSWFSTWGSSSPGTNDGDIIPSAAALPVAPASSLASYPFELLLSLCSRASAPVEIATRMGAPCFTVNLRAFCPRWG